MFKASLRSFFAHKGRMVLSVLAIALSVAFVAGTLMFTSMFTKTFDTLFASTTPDVTIAAARGTDDEFDEGLPGAPRYVPDNLTGRIAGVDGVAAVEPIINVTDATMLKGRTSLSPEGPPTILQNWGDSDGAVKLTSGQAPVGANQVLVDADTAKKKDVRIGDTLRVVGMRGEFSTTVSGIVTFTTTNPGAALFFFDMPTMREKLLGVPNVLTQIAVTAREGVSHDELRNRITSAIGPNQPTPLEIKTKAEQSRTQAEALGTVMSVIRNALLGFAALAALVGVFLIFNTFAMLVAQRTREIGLLRAIGADRGQINRSVLTEALLLAVVGSTLGLGLGYLTAMGLITVMSGFGMNLRIEDLSLTPGSAIAGYSIGFIVTLLSAMLPALRAGRISPMAALAEVGAPPSKSLVTRSLIGMTGLAAGIACLIWSTVDSLSGTNAALLLGGGIAGSLIAVIVLGPVFARAVVPVLGLPLRGVFGTVGRLSQQNALRNPRRTSATAAALMIGLSVVTGVAVVTSSIESSVNAEIDKQVGADYLVMGGMNGPPVPMSGEIVNKIRAVEGVGVLTRQRSTPRLTITSATRTEPWKTRGLATDDTFDQTTHLEYEKGTAAEALRAGGIVLGGDRARTLGVDVGDPVTVDFGNGAKVELTVGALSRSGRQAVDDDSPIISIATLDRHLPDIADMGVMLNAKAGADKTELKENLTRAMESYPQFKILDQADIKKSVAGNIEGLLATVYALLALAIFIAILGVVNTLALSVIERTREIGLMRAIGTTRRQLRRMIRLESLMIAVFGAALGLGLGMTWGVTSQQLLAREGLTILTVPWPTIVTVVLGAALVGLLAAIVPSIRASRMNVLDAIATE